MNILLDIFLVVLLSLAIGYGFILNRRILALRKDQKSLDKLATKFAEAAIRAEQSIIKLKSTTDGAFSLFITVVMMKRRHSAWRVGTPEEPSIGRFTS